MFLNIYKLEINFDRVWELHFLYLDTCMPLIVYLKIKNIELVVSKVRARFTNSGFLAK